MIYWQLFYEFFLIGLFTFGGGYAMIPLIREMVIANEWLTLEEFYSFIAVCESTPGPIAVNMATYIGSTQGGILGSFVATLGVVLPSFIIILLIAMSLKKVVQNKHFKNFVKGVVPIIAALVLFAGLTLFVKCIGIDTATFNIDISYISICIFVIIVGIYVLMLKVFKKKLSTMWVILISAALGIMLSYIFE